MLLSVGTPVERYLHNNSICISNNFVNIKYKQVLSVNEKSSFKFSEGFF